MGEKKFDISAASDGYLTGQLLVATPQLQGSFFSRCVIYMCVHNKDGAMGMVINKPAKGVSSSELLKHLDIKADPKEFDFRIYSGGPVEPGRGFVLHGSDYENTGSIPIGDTGFALTSNLEVLEDMVVENGPADALIALGYAGWSAGQLEAEIMANSWLNVPASKGLVFDADDASKWMLAHKSAGIDPMMYSEQAGHA